MYNIHSIIGHCKVTFVSFLDYFTKANLICECTLQFDNAVLASGVPSYIRFVKQRCSLYQVQHEHM